jgi:molybdenum cofactor biosynthesis enzyme MoaA
MIGGTEPPTHSYFDATLTRAREVGFRRIQLMTSGLSLESREIAADWSQRGIRSICVPLYGPDAATHDAVVRVPGHFERATRGLDSAVAAGITAYVHTLALRGTLPSLARLAELSRKRWKARLAVAPLRAKDEVFDFSSHSVSYPEVAAAIASADVSLVGFPACVAPEVPRGAALLIELYFRAQKMVFADACASCALRSDCPGVVAAHLAEYGEAGLSPR